MERESNPSSSFTTNIVVIVSSSSSLSLVSPLGTCPNRSVRERRPSWLPPHRHRASWKLAPPMPARREARQRSRGRVRSSSLPLTHRQLLLECRQVCSTLRSTTQQVRPFYQSLTELWHTTMDTYLHRICFCCYTPNLGIRLHILLVTSCWSHGLQCGRVE